eukprot:484542_1
MSLTEIFQLMDLTHIDDKDKLIVFGFVHQNQRLLPRVNSYFVIPELVIYIILFCFHNPEYFTSKNNGVYWNKKENTIGICHDGWISTVYGNIPIHGTQSIIYIWTFKIIEYYKRICIGIDSSNKTYLKTDFTKRCNKDFYATKGDKLCCLAKHRTTKVDTYEGPGWNVEMVVKMVLNVKNKTLKYIYDNKDYGIAFSNIDLETKTFHLAISLTENSQKPFCLHVCILLVGLFLCMYINLF